MSGVVICCIVLSRSHLNKLDSMFRRHWTYASDAKTLAVTTFNLHHVYLFFQMTLTTAAWPPGCPTSPRTTTTTTVARATGVTWSVTPRPGWGAQGTGYHPVVPWAWPPSGRTPSRPSRRRTFKTWPSYPSVL